MGFPDHDHLNDWDNHSASHFEQFRFSYAGQWWEGHPFTKILLLFGPFLMGLFAYLSSQNNSKYRKGDFLNLSPIDIVSYRSSIAPEI